MRDILSSLLDSLSTNLGIIFAHHRAQISPSLRTLSLHRWHYSRVRLFIHNPIALQDPIARNRPQTCLEILGLPRDVSQEDPASHQ